jgi:hypothetical protein
MLDPDPDQMNPDQQHWFYEKMYGSSFKKFVFSGTFS